MRLLFLILVFGAVDSSAFEAQILYLKGSVKTGAKDQFKTAILQQKLKEGDWVVTGKDGSVILGLGGESRLKLKENTEIQLTDTAKNLIDLKLGSVFSKIRKLENPDQKSEIKFRIRTRTATMGVRGTQFFTAYGEGKKQEDDVWMCVQEGVVEVEKSGVKPVIVNEGFGVFVPKEKPVSEPKPFGWTKELNWNMDPETGPVEDRTRIRSAYTDFLKYNYD